MLALLVGDGDGVRTQRDELRELVIEVGKRARYLTVIASHHRGVLADLMNILGASSNNDDARRAGVLVDAEG